LNTKLRQNSTNDFDKALFKFFINSCFGKFLENKRKHSNVKLVNHWEGRYGAESLISSPFFKRIKIFEENLVAIEMRKMSITLDRPLYVGQSILDISKTLMYDFHYNYIKKNYANFKLIYGDTDSFAYYCKTPDIYAIIKRDIDLFDTSNYSTNNIYEIPRVNKCVLGKFKDEMSGEIIEEMICLKPKMVLIYDGGGGVKKINKEICKAKGVKQCIVKNKIRFRDSKKCLKKREIVQSEVQNLIKSNNHILYSISQRKNTLSAYDDKRHWLDDGINSLAYGHYKIIV